MDSHAVKSQQNVAVHTISFRGKAGAIFVLLFFTFALFLVGFITPRWSKIDDTYLGIWENCTCLPHNYAGDAQLIAINSLLAASFLFLLISLLLITIYMCVHTPCQHNTVK
ncbi:hypothetical protein HELRODRAFT_161652 [Helobdella robusta]|uniref:Uncharacterized protein n=1 Tax=Helobdella robusta TaxID=6412 RepID=T1ERR1_HELRO|nr:hypothetical protein HELRODRAFT_161652 [Helobdella robusta]ESO02387.1 hypothetical protein HELRODRAFT_161652 [Helobdella robusta]